MKNVFIVSVYLDDGALTSFLLPFEEVSECLSVWCFKRSRPCVVYNYELGSMTRDEFMSWIGHNFSDFDLAHFEFEYDVSLFN